MNASFFHLLLCNVVQQSPIITSTVKSSHGALDISFFSIFKSFNLLVYSNQGSDIKIRHGSVCSMLNGGVLLDSGYEVRSESQIFNISAPIHIEHVIFSDCQAHNREGGAVLVICEQSKAIINNCYFIRCSTTFDGSFGHLYYRGGGAFTIISNEAASSCILCENCATNVNRAPAFHIATAYLHNFQEISMSDIDTHEVSGCAFIVEICDVIGRGINSTNNYLLDGAGFGLGGNTRPVYYALSYINVYNCSGLSKLYLQCTGNGSSLSYANFVKGNIVSCTLIHNSMGFHSFSHLYVAKMSSITAYFLQPANVSVVESWSDEPNQDYFSYVEDFRTLSMGVGGECRIRTVSFTQKPKKDFRFHISLITAQMLLY